MIKNSLDSTVLYSQSLAADYKLLQLSTPIQNWKVNILSSKNENLSFTKQVFTIQQLPLVRNSTDHHQNTWFKVCSYAYKDDTMFWKQFFRSAYSASMLLMRIFSLSTYNPYFKNFEALKDQKSEIIYLCNFISHRLAKKSQIFRYSNIIHSKFVKN